MEMRPYDFSSKNTRRFTEQVRLGVDLFIVIVYAYLLFTVEEVKNKPEQWMGKYFLGFPVVFGSYLLSGLARRRSHGRIASNPTPIMLFLPRPPGLFPRPPLQKAGTRRGFSCLGGQRPVIGRDRLKPAKLGWGPGPIGNGKPWRRCAQPSPAKGRGAASPRPFCTVGAHLSPQLWKTAGFTRREG